MQIKDYLLFLFPVCVDKWEEIDKLIDSKKINDIEYERNIRSNDKSFERIDIEDNDYPVKYKEKTSLN